MDTKFVKIKFDVRCDWNGFWPDYRIYVNDEMFTERTFKWDNNTFITETVQVQACPGIYNIRLEAIAPETGTFTTTPISVHHGDATILDINRFEIL